MIISGYLDGSQPPFEESPLIDGTALLVRPGFWPAFLHSVGGSVSAVDAFEDDLADVSALLDQLMNPQSWPVLTVPLSRHHRLHIVMRNFPDDSGVDYVLAPADGSRHIPLAALEGHFRGPALSWPELLAVAGQPDDGGLSPAARLLLLQPVTADADTPPEGATTVAAALTSVGAATLHSVVATELLHDVRHWSPATWTRFNDINICTEPHSYRAIGGGLTQRELEIIEEALEGAPLGGG